MGGTASAPEWSGPAYDAWFDQPWGHYTFGVESAAVLAGLGPLADRRVVDVGCGTGRLAELMVAAGARVVGLDIEPSMLAVAAIRTTVPLLEGDAHRLPMHTASVDATIAVAVLEFVTDPAAVVAEMWRATRPGGQVVVGALNRRSAWGLTHRRELRRPPWTAARFLDHRALLALAKPYGPPHLTLALFAPGALPGLNRIGPLLELLGHLVPHAAAFRVLSIERS
jgi:SAM-dependent methyltransferase